MSDRRGRESEAAAATPHARGVEAVAVRSEDGGDGPTRIRSSNEIAPRETPEWVKRLIGVELDHFELLDCIGEGGMGRVFQARDIRLERLVAVKVLNPEFTDDLDMRRRFEQEAKAAARLESPFFARVHHVGFDKGVRFIAMELVEGRTLRREIADGGRVEPAFALRIGAAVAYALHHAAQRDIVHRDVKPSNIVVDADGAVKLIDMGLARDFLQTTGDATQTNVTMGTLDYISPEQASDPRGVDVRSDIYSLGCTLYHALTGRPPFPEGTDLQKLLSHQSEKPPDPRDVVPETPEEFAALVMSMMSKRPVDRPQSPAELIHRLQEVAAALDVAMPTSAPILPPPPRQAWWHQPLLWWGPVLALLVAVVVLASIPGEREPDPTWATRPPAGQPAAAESKDRPAKLEAPKRVGVGPVLIVAEHADLAKAVKDAPEGAVLQLAGDEYALAATEDAGALRGLVVDKNLSIEPRAERGRVRLRFQPVALGGAVESLALVQVRAAKLNLTRVWIEPGVRERPCVGIRVDQGELELSNCVFDRGVDAMTPIVNGATAIAIHGGVVLVRDSRFVAGDCVVRTAGGASTVHLWNSLVGPYRRAFAFDGKTDAQIKHSAFLAGGEAIFTLNNPSAVALAVEHSVFAAAPSSPTAILIDSPKNQPFPASLWKGLGNLYAGGFARRIVAGGRAVVEDLAVLRQWGFADEAAQRTNEWPWTSSSESIAGFIDESESWRPLLVLKDGIANPTSDGLPVGVNPGSEAAVAADAALKTPTSKAPPRNDADRVRGDVWTVDSSQTTDEAAGVFATLAAAVQRAPVGKSTPIALARGKGELRERNVKIVGKTIVLRSAERRSIRLAEPKDMEIGPATVFEIGAGGKLEFDGVELDAFAGRSDPAGSSLVRCSFGGVVEANRSTLRISQGQGAQAMVLFRTSSAGAEEGAAPPLLKLNRCDVRGAGSLLVSDPRQPWTLEASSCRFGSDGPLVRLSGASAKAAEATANVVKFRQCAVLLGSSLLTMEPNADAFGSLSATPVQFDVEGSLFLAASATTPLLDVSAPIGPRLGGDWSNAVRWQGDWNVVAGFVTLLRIPETDRSAGMATTAFRSLSFSDWLSANRLAAGKQYYQAAPPTALRSVWDVSLPRGDEWLKWIGGVPGAFGDQTAFEGLP